MGSLFLHKESICPAMLVILAGAFIEHGLCYPNDTEMDKRAEFFPNKKWILVAILSFLLKAE